MKQILLVVAYLVAIIIALNLFNNGYVFEAFVIVIISVVSPIYFYLKNQGNKKDEKDLFVYGIMFMPFSTRYGNIGKYFSYN